MRRLRRSKLFAPGNRPDLMAKALASKADSVSFDLEDAVPAAEKENARRLVAERLADLAGCAKEIVVRVNGAESAALIDDLEAVARPGLDVVNLPKVEDPRQIYLVDRMLAHLEAKRGIERPIAVAATLETPRGLRLALDIALASPRVSALQLGLGDLSAVVGLQPSGDGPAYPRALIAFAAAEAGIDALDSAFTDIADPAGFEAEARRARALGLRGKSCIHPTQIEAANRVFGPTAAELEEARGMVDAYDAATRRGIGAVAHAGKLVDFPIAEQARRLLAAAAAPEGGR